MSIPESDLLIYKRMLQETSETDESAASQKSVNADTYAASVSEITDENELQTIDSEAFEDENTEEAEISDTKDTKETTETTADSAKNTEEKEESKETTDTEEADENNTSEYTLADFKKYAEDNSKIKKVLDGVDYEKVFDAIDEDGDGKLSEEELGAISKGSKELSDITAGELKKFIKNIDTDSEEDETAFENLLNKIKEALGLSDETAAETAAPAAASGGGSTGGYSGGGYSGGSGSSNTSSTTNASASSNTTTEDESADLDEQIKQLEEVDIPKSESELQELAETKDKDIKEQQEIQEKAIEESDEIDQELKDEYKTIEEALTKAQEGKSKSENTKAEKESELSSITSQIGEIEAQISAIDTNTDDEEKNAENAQLVAELNNKKGELEKKKTELEEAIKAEEETISDFEKTIEEQEKAKEAVLEEIKANLDPDSPLLKTIEETEEKMDEIETDYTKESEELEGTLEEQRTKLAELKEQRGTQEGESHNGGEFASLFDKCAEFANGVLAGMGDYIEQVCEKYNIDPWLVSAIMAQETGYGTSSAIKNQNNPGGYMDSATNYQTIKSFGSLEEGIEAVVRNLSNGYTSQGLTTIKTIGQKYCPVGAANDPTGLNSGWIPGVTSIYNKLTGKNITCDTDLALT